MDLKERGRTGLHVAAVPLLVVASVAFHFAMDASFGLDRPYVALFLGVLAASWIGGIEMALVVALLSAGVGHFALYRPGPGIPGPYISLVMFLMISMTLAGVLNSWRQALRRTASALAQLREHERELEAARDAAEAGNRTKSRFLATVSHEIRTPMNAVVGMSNLLLDEPLTHEQREFAETIHSSAESLLAVLNDVLDFSKIESGRLELERCAFELRECVESALDLLAPGAAAKGLELMQRFDASLPEVVVGDPTRVRQILINLVGNAIKFTERGEIEVALGASEEAGPTRELRLSVRDTGLGIPADRRERLFHSFSQGDASTTRRHGGTGLGLAISRKLAEAMGGTIRAESAGVPGLGATFHVAIRVEVPETTAPDREPGDTHEPALAGKRVLVVDDNDTQREILEAELARWGVRCAGAADGDEALARLAAGERFDAALVDRAMPAMDGEKLAQAIRAREEALPIALMLAADAVEEPGRSALFATVLKKPVKRSRLWQALVELLASEPGSAAARRAPAKLHFDAGLAARAPLRILLAEDSPTNQRLALLMLARMGYRADVAADGVEALAALERGRHDLVLMDFEMPEMDGIEATRRIRARGASGPQPCIVGLTANASTADHERCFEAGMDACLVKPVRPAELQATLERCAGASDTRAD